MPIEIALENNGLASSVDPMLLMLIPIVGPPKMTTQPPNCTTGEARCFLKPKRAAKHAQCHMSKPKTSVGTDPDSVRECATAETKPTIY